MFEANELLYKISTAQSLASLNDILREFIAPYGYDQTVYHLVTDHPSLQLPAQTLIYEYVDEWRDLYVTKNLIKDDPVLKNLNNFRSAFYWSKLDSLDLADNEQYVMNKGREIGLYHGLSLPLYGPNGETAILSLASSDDTVDEHEHILFILNTIAYHVHHRFCQLTTDRLQQAQDIHAGASVKRGNLHKIDSISHFIQQLILPKNDREFIQQAFHVVKENYRDPNFKVEELANRLNMVTRTLQRRFNSISMLQITPRDLIREYRLEQSIIALIQGIHVDLVAYQVGFSPDQYGKYFKDKHGVTPRQYQQFHKIVA